MNPNAIEKAEKRLRLAITHANELPNSKSFTEFADHWYQYLVAFNNVLTLLKKGAKAAPSSRQWFGKKEAERRQDQLVQYLFQARDDDEHGIGSVLTFTPAKAFFISDNAGDSSITLIDNDGSASGTMNIKSTDGKRVRVRLEIAQTALSKVTGRGPVEYLPPRIHNGKLLTDNSPAAVANLGIAYLETVIREAKGMA